MKNLLILIMIGSSALNLSSQTVDSTLLNKLNHLSINNSRVAIPDILFFNSMKSNEQEILFQTLLSYLKTNPVCIKVIVHTDCRGDIDYNDAISDRKADIIQRWFARRGIEEDRISIIGGGENYPIIDCENCSGCSEEEHQVNRRIEVILLRPQD